MNRNPLKLTFAVDLRASQHGSVLVKPSNKMISFSEISMSKRQFIVHLSSLQYLIVFIVIMIHKPT